MFTEPGENVISFARNNPIIESVELEINELAPSGAFTAHLIETLLLKTLLTAIIFA